MNWVRSRAILLSGILTPAMSFMSRVGCRCASAKLMGLSLTRTGALRRLLDMLAALELLVGCCRTCCEIASATRATAWRVRPPSRAWLEAVGLDIAIVCRLNEIAVGAKSPKSKQQG